MSGPISMGDITRGLQALYDLREIVPKTSGEVTQIRVACFHAADKPPPEMSKADWDVVHAAEEIINEHFGFDKNRSFSSTYLLRFLDMLDNKSDGLITLSDLKSFMDDLPEKPALRDRFYKYLDSVINSMAQVVYKEGVNKREVKTLINTIRNLEKITNILDSYDHSN